MTGEKCYVMFKSHFKDQKSKFKYFGFAPKFSDHMLTKGNRINTKGIYFGCGGSNTNERDSISSLSNLKKLVQ